MIAARPRVLIADDDPVSLAFLQAVVERCGCTALAAASAQAALARLQVDVVDLLLIDRRMPGMDGVALLLAARALGICAPAIATSAELDRSTTSALHAAGFAGTLLKPASLATIQRLLQRFLAPEAIVTDDEAAGSERARSMALLDDTAALSAIGGDREALRALRALFAAELDDVAGEAKSGVAAERAALAERLHRMRASCSFCGAPALAVATLRLECALRDGTGDIDSARVAFLQMCAATKQALTPNA
jgi:CheY-like chemotaxis protein/HPt (histidine-containing phosphotransfer) domain-containing protein